MDNNICLLKKNDNIIRKGQIIGEPPKTAGSSKTMVNPSLATKTKRKQSNRKKKDGSTTKQQKKKTSSYQKSSSKHNAVTSTRKEQSLEEQKPTYLEVLLLTITLGMAMFVAVLPTTIGCVLISSSLSIHHATVHDAVFWSRRLANLLITLASQYVYLIQLQRSTWYPQYVGSIILSVDTIIKSS